MQAAPAVAFLTEMTAQSFAIWRAISSTCAVVMSALRNAKITRARSDRASALT